MAIEVGKQIVTSNEVTKYIDAVVLSSKLQSELFLKADSDYSAYKALKAQLVSNIFKTTVQQIAVTRLLQAQAIRMKDRQYFALTKQQMAEALETSIKSSLAPYKKNGHAQ